MTETTHSTSWKPVPAILGPVVMWVFWVRRSGELEHFLKNKSQDRSNYSKNHQKNLVVILTLIKRGSECMVIRVVLCVEVIFTIKTWQLSSYRNLRKSRAILFFAE